MEKIKDLSRLKESISRNIKASGLYHKEKVKAEEQKRLADMADQSTISPSSNVNGTTTPSS